MSLEALGAPSMKSRDKHKFKRLRLYLVRHGESKANQRGVFAGQLDSPLTERGIEDARSLGRNSPLLPPTSSVYKTSRTRHVSFDGVYSSDLSRAHDTSKLILEGLRERAIASDRIAECTYYPMTFDTVLDRRLRERSYGTLQGRPWYSDRSETDKIWREEHDEIEPPLWESDEDVWIRVKSFLLELIQDEINIASTNQNECNPPLSMKDQLDNRSQEAGEGKEPKHILITSHGGVIRQILLRLVGLEKLRDSGAKFDEKRHHKLITPNTSLTILELSFRPDHLKPSSIGNGNEETGQATSNNGETTNGIEDLQGADVKLVSFANIDHLEGKITLHDD